MTEPSFPELCCPLCKGSLDVHTDAYYCRSCNHSYPVVLGIPDFRVFPDPYISIENDHKKGRFLSANAAHISFDNLVRFYWSITPNVPSDMIERFSRKAILLADKWAQALPELEAQFSAPPPSGVLEIGCGTGGFLAAAARRYDHVVGIDIAFRWLIVARKRLDEAGLDIPLICACAEHLPFKDDQFELVFGEATLEHVRDQAATLREIQRVGYPGGTLSLITANRYSVGPEPHVHVWGVGFLPRRWMNAYVTLIKGTPYQYLRLVSRFELSRLLHRAGFYQLRFTLPDVTPVESAQFTPEEYVQLRLYRAVRHIPLINRLLYLFGPLLQVTCRFQR